MPKKTDNDIPGVLSRTQIVWIAFVASMTIFGGFFVFTGPVDVTAPPAAMVSGSVEPIERTTTFASANVRDWTHVVIHHSGLQLDDHESIDRRHRQNGLLGNGYHFVIGNGFGRTADGAKASPTKADGDATCAGTSEHGSPADEPSSQM